VSAHFLSLKRPTLDNFWTPFPVLSQKGLFVSCFLEEKQEKSWNDAKNHRIFAMSKEQNKF
jgi:hypothetical protein